MIQRTNGAFDTLQDKENDDEAFNISTQKIKFEIDQSIDKSNSNNNNLKNQTIPFKRENTNFNESIHEVHDTDLRNMLKKPKHEINTSDIQKLNDQTIPPTDRDNKLTTTLTSFTSLQPQHSQTHSTKTISNSNNEFHNTIKQTLQDVKLLDSTGLTINKVNKEGQSTSSGTLQTSKTQQQQQQQQQQQNKLSENVFQHFKVNPQMKLSEHSSSSLFNTSPRITNNQPSHQTTSSPLFLDLTQEERPASISFFFHQKSPSVSKVDPVLIVIPDSEGTFH
jgi:hypothetical protein